MDPALPLHMVLLIWKVLEQPLPPRQEGDSFIFFHVLFQEPSSCLANNTLNGVKNKTKTKQKPTKQKKPQHQN